MSKNMQSILHLAALASTETDTHKHGEYMTRMAEILAADRREHMPGSDWVAVSYPNAEGAGITQLEVVYYADEEDSITDVYAFAQDSAVNLAPMLDWDTLCDLIADKAYDAAVNQHKAQRASDAEDRAEHWRMAA